MSAGPDVDEQDQSATVDDRLGSEFDKDPELLGYDLLRTPAAAAVMVVIITAVIGTYALDQQCMTLADPDSPIGEGLRGGNPPLPSPPPSPPSP